MIKNKETDNALGFNLNTLIELKSEGAINTENYKIVLKMYYKKILSKRAEERYRLERDERIAQEKKDFEAKANADIEKYGYFCMEVFMRDCDMCETTHISKYSSIKEMEESMQATYEDAEGYVSFTYAHPLDAENFEPSFRDRTMEAYENGNGTSILV